MSAEFPLTEKVRALLTEYSALRAEIVARMNHGYQLLVVGTAALAFYAAIYRDAPRQLLWFIAILMVIVYVFAVWFILRDIYKLAARVREIEIDVNDRYGEDLLLWENLSGGAKIGFWVGFKPLPRDKLKTLPEPIRTRRGELISPSSTSAPPAAS